MMDSQVYSQLVPCIQNVLQPLGWRGEIKADSNLFHLGLDSISAMTLLMEIENQFKIVFSEEDLRPELFEQVESLVETICSKKGEL